MKHCYGEEFNRIHCVNRMIFITDLGHPSWSGDLLPFVRLRALCVVHKQFYISNFLKTTSSIVTIFWLEASLEYEKSKLWTLDLTTPEGPIGKATCVYKSHIFNNLMRIRPFISLSVMYDIRTITIHNLERDESF